jgi:hypothetical protein
MSTTNHCHFAKTITKFKEMTTTRNYARVCCVLRGSRWTLKKKTTMMKFIRHRCLTKTTTKFKEMTRLCSWSSFPPRGSKWLLKKKTTMSYPHHHHHAKATTKFKEMTTTCGHGCCFLGGNIWVLIKRQWRYCHRPRATTGFKEMTTTTSYGETTHLTWPHTKTPHNGAPWWCEMVPSRWTEVRLLNSSNGFVPKCHKYGSKGFLSGALGELSVHPFCEGVDKGFFLAHALEAKRGLTWSSPFILPQVPDVCPRGTTWCCSQVG